MIANNNNSNNNVDDLNNLGDGSLYHIFRCGSKLCQFQSKFIGETSLNLNKRFSWHNSCFRNPNAYSFCKILNTHFGKFYCKDSSYTIDIIEKLEGTGRTDRNTIDFTAEPIQKARDA